MRTMSVTNQEVGSKIGLTHTAVSRIRNAGRLPSFEVMTHIAREFGWSLDAQAVSREKGTYATDFEGVLSEYATTRDASA